MKNDVKTQKLTIVFSKTELGRTPNIFSFVTATQIYGIVSILLMYIHCTNHLYIVLKQINICLVHPHKCLILMMHVQILFTIIPVFKFIRQKCRTLMLIEFLYVISCRFPDDMALIDVQQDFYRKCHIIQNTVGSVDGLLIYDCVIAWPSGQHYFNRSVHASVNTT